MNTNKRCTYAAVFFFLLPSVLFAQAPTLGTAADFALFSSIGAVSNTGTSDITGNVGTNVGSSTNFGPLKGAMHDQDGTSAKAATDLLVAYNQLNAATATLFPAPLLGNGQVLGAGIYSISSAASLTLGLTLDAKGDPNAVFIFKIQGAFSAAASASVTLINGAKACNVFWKIEGLVNLATNATMRGTIIANNGAITMYTGVILEGRALSTTGAITVASVLVHLPIGCVGVVTGLGDSDINTTQSAIIQPNPFHSSPITIRLQDEGINTELKVYNLTGAEVMEVTLVNSSTTLQTEGLLAGMYVYKLFRNGHTIQTGRLISQ